MWLCGILSEQSSESVGYGLPSSGNPNKGKVSARLVVADGRVVLGELERLGLSAVVCLLTWPFECVGPCSVAKPIACYGRVS